MSAELAVNVEFDRSDEGQLYYDLTTQFAEIVDGPMSTKFELILVGDDLISEDGRSMDQVTADSLKEVDEVYKDDPVLRSGIIRRWGHEREEFVELVDMAKGNGPNTMVVDSDFMQELLGATEDIGGWNVKRKQTMLRVITRKENGKLTMHTATLDGSDRIANEAIYKHLGQPVEAGELLGQRIRVNLDSDRQDLLAEELTDVYDQSLRDRFGGEWHAGRKPADYRNTYDFVCTQEDLIAECLRLDSYGWLNRDIMYDMAATMNKRFKKAGLYGDLYTEIKQAGVEARALGQRFSACGDTLGASNLLELAGYGSGSGEDEYGSLYFKCSNGHDNTRPRGKFIDNCRTCGISVRC